MGRVIYISLKKVQYIYKNVRKRNLTKGLSLTRSSNAGRDDMIFDPPKFQIPKI